MKPVNEQTRLRAVVETAVDGVILIDAQGVILMFNPACERLFGYASFEVIGRNVKMLMPEPYQGEHDGYLSNYRETGERKIIGIGREVLGRKRSGATFPMDLSVGEAEEDGKPIFVGVIRDLTDRRRAEQALREGTARLQAMLDTAVDGVILIDARGQVLMFNPACERLFGYHAGEIVGQNVKKLMPDPYRSEHDGYISAYRKTGERKIIGIGREVQGRRRDGSTFPMELSVGEAKQEGESIFVGIIHDLTSRKRTEEQLAQAQKMEMVGQLSGGIAHDFNNLLTVILGNAEALGLRLKARDDLRGLADAIVDSAERGAELTRRLLAFSRRQILAASTIDCNAMVKSMEVLMTRSLRGDIALQATLSPTPVYALADGAQLENAILNLALNAQDAMPDGGVIVLSVSDAEIDQETFGPRVEVKAGHYAVICVTDDGVGMARETLERAFEPFFTTKEVGKGSGLGLSMVYGFARQSGGHVSIYSEPGLGTSVRIYLPIAEQAAASAAAARILSTQSSPGGDESIFIVEDDPFVRAHAISSLESLGYRVTVASDGREALAALRAGVRPALLFTDVVMPGGVSGLELAAQARALQPDLRVLFTSGYPREVLTGRGQLDPGSDLLNKPYRLADLARHVRAALDGGS
ncbi:PAS domain S-box protein [Terricaulis sp.]|uniref:PAS domain S-box protein n=1 Tax=Terricaulis sp. TaxID=2768686 RepID=UPI00378405EE